MAALDERTFTRSLIETDIEAYLDKYQNKELLRFVAVGSVDDGKSTLIGRCSTTRAWSTRTSSTP